MTTFTCTLDQFYKLGKEFDLSLKTNPTRAEAEAGWHCLSLHYLGIEHENEVSEIMAAQRLKWWSKNYIFWDVAAEIAERNA